MSKAVIFSRYCYYKYEHLGFSQKSSMCCLLFTVLETITFKAWVSNSHQRLPSLCTRADIPPSRLLRRSLGAALRSRAEWPLGVGGSELNSTRRYLWMILGSKELWKRNHGLRVRGGSRLTVCSTRTSEDPPSGLMRSFELCCQLGA